MVSRLSVLSTISGLLLVVCCGTSVSAASVDDDGSNPRIKTVELKEFTKLTLDIVPDLGTRFTFPFLLDETGRKGLVPFTLNISNKIFKPSEIKEGRNSFVLTVPPFEDGKPLTGQFLGDLFVTVAGYNISVRLRTTRDIRRHYTDINFVMSKEDRLQLIEEAVEKRFAAAQAEFEKKKKNLDRQAERLALAMIGRLAIQKPDEVRVKEESDLALPSGDRLTLYVDRLLRYGEMTVVPFTLYADTSGTVKITAVQLYGIKEAKGEEFLIDAGMLVRRRVDSGEEVRGVVSTDMPGIAELKSLRLVVLTNLGEVSLKW